jgi:hypothetical protein
VSVFTPEPVLEPVCVCPCVVNDARADAVTGRTSDKEDSTHGDVCIRRRPKDV